VRQVSCGAQPGAPGWSKQQGWPRPPQAMQVSPIAATTRHVDPGAVQVASQQRCPTRPQAPQAPSTQTAPSGQSTPSATQVPGSLALVRAQQPPAQPLRAQQVWPGPPQGTHWERAGMSAIMMTQARSAAHPGWPRSAAGQHGAPPTPQPLHRPTPSRASHTP
jgi:hypothetical protein